MQHVLTFVGSMLMGFPHSMCRVEDYWIGYKLFCFAYYSNSRQHESEFEQSKLGWFIGHIAASLVMTCLFRFDS